MSHWKLTGNTFRRGRRWYADAICACGRPGQVQLTKDGVPKSRSCYPCSTRLRVRHGHAGHGGSPTYKIWQMMIDRCHNGRSRSFENYGARGIAVCARWRQSFEAFLEDMGERPPGLSIERQNNDGNYEPGNCVWASRKIQANNSRQNRRLSYRGETLTAAQWAERTGISRYTLLQRVDRDGMSVAEALDLPVDCVAVRRLRCDFATLTYKGETLTRYQWAERTGLNPSTIRFRQLKGWPVEKILETPARPMRAKRQR